MWGAGLCVLSTPGQTHQDRHTGSVNELRGSGRLLVGPGRGRKGGAAPRHGWHPLRDAQSSMTPVPPGASR